MLDNHLKLLTAQPAPGNGKTPHYGDLNKSQCKVCQRPIETLFPGGSPNPRSSWDGLIISNILTV